MMRLQAPNHPLRLAGYAALFDTPDADRDTIKKGAFLETLASREEKLPLLWQHRAESVIGTVEEISEDARGLRIIALVSAVQTRAAQALRNRQVSGLSFGYRARRASHNAEGRQLLAIDLFEVSLVTHPLQFGARVHMIS